MRDKITVVITSCNRYDLLYATIYSFLNYNTYPIAKYIIVDDSADIEFHKKIKEEFGSIFEIICNEKREGQIASIDKAYSKVNTEYIFHLEDDWQFYKKSFIEPSLEILKSDAKILQVWLREINDTNGHPIESDNYNIGDVNYLRVALNYYGYHGFSFNPGLRRLSDYNLIKPFSNILFDKTKDASRRARFYTPEEEISERYKELGFRSVILQHGYVKHIGWERRVDREA